MLIAIDHADSTPLFEQIAAAVRSGIADGSIRSGERMPTARELCASLDVNRNTVLHAYQALRDEGLIELRRGRGAIVGRRGTARGSGARAGHLGGDTLSPGQGVLHMTIHRETEEHARAGSTKR
jgi:GntR family transcriptional regulator